MENSHCAETLEEADKLFKAVSQVEILKDRCEKPPGVRMLDVLEINSVLNGW